MCKFDFSSKNSKNRAQMRSKICKKNYLKWNEILETNKIKTRKFSKVYLNLKTSWMIKHLKYNEKLVIKKKNSKPSMTNSIKVKVKSIYLRDNSKKWKSNLNNKKTSFKHLFTEQRSNEKLTFETQMKKRNLLW